MEEVIRNYSFKDVDMLLGSKTVVDGGLEVHLEELQEIRSNWTEQYVADFKARIDNAISKYLGLDPKKGLRNATKAVYDIQIPALKDIAMFKVQVDADYLKDKVRKEEIFRSLGITDHLKHAQAKDHEALVQLLYAYKMYMTTALKTEITAKGMKAALVDRISGYADSLKAANVAQGSLKLSTKGLTKEAITEFNAIHDEVMAICKIASKHYQKDKLIKEKFTFSKIISNMGAHNNDNTKDNPPATELKP